MLGLGGSLTNSSTRTHEQMYSVVCDGTGDYIRVRDDGDAFSFGDGSNDDPFSISLWYKTSDVTIQPLITKTGDATSKREWYFAFGSNDKIYLGLYDFSAGKPIYIYTGALTSTEGAWTHVAATYGGGGVVTDLEIYVNGTLQSVTRSTVAGYVAMENTAYDIWIGGYNAFGYSLNGNIDEVAIFNVELDADAVTDIYNNSKPFELLYNRGNYDNSSAIVGYWRMNDGSGTTVVDSSGNFRDGTLAADAAFSADTPDD